MADDKGEVSFDLTTTPSGFRKVFMRRALGLLGLTARRAHPAPSQSAVPV